MVGNDNGVHAGFDTGQRFVHRHDSLDNEGNARISFDIFQFGKTLRSDRLAHPGHVDQRGGIDVNAESHGAGLGGFIGQLHDAFRFPGLDDGNAASLFRFDRGQSTLKHGRIRSISRHSQHTGLSCSGHHGRGVFRFAQFRFHIHGRSANRRRQHRHTQILSKQGRVHKRRIDPMYGSQIQFDLGQGCKIVAKTHPGSDTAHPGHFASTGNSIANRADPAGTMKTLFGASFYLIPFHLEHLHCFPVSIAFIRLRLSPPQGNRDGRRPKTP